MRSARKAGVIAVVVGALTLAAASGYGDDRKHRGHEADLFITVPLEHDTSVIFPFGGSHHEVPGTVTINRDPYVCVAHRRSFRERDPFVEHLRVEHRIDDAVIREHVVVREGQVRYVGD